MSLKTTVGIAGVAVLGCAAGAFYWLHTRAAQRLPDLISAEPPGFREAPSAEKPTNAAAVKSVLPADSNKAASPVDTGLPLKAGEVLEYAANVSKLHNVARPKWQDDGRGKLWGKRGWRL